MADLPELPEASSQDTDQAFNSAFTNAYQRQPAGQVAPEATSSEPVNLINPEGKLVSVPGQHVPDAIANGYTEASEQDVHNHFRHEKYGGLGQQAITGLEGAGSALTFGTSTGVETALGVNAEDIRERSAENPGSQMLGQGIGLVGSALLPEIGAGAKGIAGAGAALEGIGAASKILGGAGELAAKVAGLSAPETILAKIGSSAVKGVAENALVQSGNEFSKMFAQDPGQSAQTAIADIGLAALLGGGIAGGFGAISPLWKATMGNKLNGTLNAITEKLGGAEGREAPSAMEKAIDASGIDVDPVMKAAITGDPSIQQHFQTLMDSSTKNGLLAKEKLAQFKGQISDKALSLLGKSPEDISALEDLSPKQVGESIKDNIKTKLEEDYAPIKRDYETISNRFKETEVPQEVKASLSQSLGELANNGALPDSAEATFLQRVIKQVPKIENLEQLRKFTSALGNETSGITKQELWNIGRGVRSALNGAEETTLNQAVAKDAPELLQKHLDTNKAYRELKTRIGDLNDRIKVGDRAGVGTFIKALGDADGETILSRLNPQNRAGIIDELATHFPEVHAQVKDFHLSNLVKKAAKYGTQEEPLNFTHLTRELDKLSPEMKKFIVPEGASEGIKTLQALVDGLPEKVGKSGTPQGLDALMSGIPASAVGAIAALTGHNPIVGALLGHLGKLVARDVPDAGRMALLKFLGSSAQVDSGAFKTAVDFIHSTMKGENLLSKASKSIFKAGQEVLPEAALPSRKDIEKLDKRLKDLQTTPEAQINQMKEVGGQTAHYLPDHGMVLTQTATVAAQYLNSLRPAQDKRSPLDTKPVVNASQKARFDSALSIAQQPMVVLDKIKKGTLNSHDTQDLKTMYPSLYNRMIQKLTGDMNDHMAKGDIIPYKTRIGLSLFAGVPLDSTMTGPAIMAAQPLPTAQPGGQVQGKGEIKHTGTAFNKLPGMYSTQSQKAEANVKGG